MQKEQKDAEKALMQYLHPLVEERDGRYFTAMQHNIDVTKKIAYFKKYLNELFDFRILGRREPSDLSKIIDHTTFRLIFTVDTKPLRFRVSTLGIYSEKDNQTRRELRKAIRPIVGVIRKLFFLSLVFLLPSLSYSSEVYFSPEGHVRDQIIKRINHSKQTIDVAVYSFTAGEIAQALADAHKRGVAIRIIRDASQSSDKHDENSFLSENGIPVEIRSGRGRGIMHDKFAVFDGKEFCTGSYNWTNNAEHNNWENWLCSDEEKLIRAYQKEFEALWTSPAKKVVPRNRRH